MLGFSSSFNDDNYGIRFDSGVADTFGLVRAMDFMNTNACISDTSGQLLFYTNGIYVANRNHDSILNTNNFNPGTATTAWYYGLRTQQACLILPVPESDSLYYIFHESGETIPGGMACPVNLSYSEVDMSLDNGLGGITGIKNVHLIEDTLTFGRVSACKHANGRDYWVLVHAFYSDKFYKLLITPDTIFISTQNIGLPNNIYPRNAYGQSIFTPDGTKYAIEINDLTPVNCLPKFFQSYPNRVTDLYSGPCNPPNCFSLEDESCPAICYPPCNQRTINANAEKPDQPITVFPNPSQSIVNISNMRKGQEILIYNSIGNCLFKAEAEGSSVPVDISGFPEGIYLVKVDNEAADRFIKVQ